MKLPLRLRLQGPLSAFNGETTADVIAKCAVSHTNLETEESGILIILTTTLILVLMLTLTVTIVVTIAGMC